MRHLIVLKRKVSVLKILKNKNIFSLSELGLYYCPKRKITISNGYDMFFKRLVTYILSDQKDVYYKTPLLTSGMDNIYEYLRLKGICKIEELLEQNFESFYNDVLVYSQKMEKSKQCKK